MRTFTDPKSVEVRAGERLAIALSGNPTTGYTWALADEIAALPLRGSRVRATAEAAGAGGVEEFEFEAAEPGSHVLRFVRRREWEQGKPLDERTVAVTVRA